MVRTEVAYARRAFALRFGGWTPWVCTKVLVQSSGVFEVIRVTLTS